jgi:hypothetical protein
MGEAIADMFTAVAARSPRLSAERSDESSSWEEITKAWQR